MNRPCGWGLHLTGLQKMWVLNLVCLRLITLPSNAGFGYPLDPVSGDLCTTTLFNPLYELFDPSMGFAH